MADTRTPDRTEFDVIIVGGGPSGCSLGALLAQGGISVLVIDRENAPDSLAPPFDGRTTAISFGSRNVLAAAGAWDEIESAACPIGAIDITEGGAPAMLEFLSSDVDAAAFGWVVENRHLRAALYKALAGQSCARHLTGTGVTAIAASGDAMRVTTSGGAAFMGALVVGADGRQSFTRQAAGIATRGKDYRQRAVVCIAAHENPHENRAVEDFRAEGPFAILPMKDGADGRHRSAVVWTEHAGAAGSAAAWDEVSFNAALSERFPARYGAVSAAGPRFSYPLSLIHAHDYVAERVALIADAAHGIHPIAGQGLNMGLRDVASLAQILREAHRSGRDLGDADLLRRYERERRADTMLMAGATDTLNALFQGDAAPVRLLRRLGLRAVARLPRAKRVFMTQAMGKSGLLPALVRHGDFPQ